MYEIEVTGTFNATHALRLPDGSFEPVHGHDWRVRVTVASDRLDAMDCVMDFHELERIVAGITAPWAGTHLNDVEPFAGRINPSAERIVERIADAVARQLPRHVRLAQVSVTEAPGCVAVYRP